MAKVFARQAFTGSPPGPLRSQLLASAAAALQAAGLHELAGDMYAWQQQPKQALACYSTGHAHSKAVAVAAALGQEAQADAHTAWAEWFMARRQHGAAVEHYTAAGQSAAAFEAALAGGRDLQQAALILRTTEVCSILAFLCRCGPRPHSCHGLSLLPPQHKNLAKLHAQDLAAEKLNHARLAAAYEAAGKLPEAEAALHGAGAPEEAVGLWLRAGRWEDAKHAAAACMEAQAARSVLTEHAQQAEGRRDWAEAECAWLAAGEVDAAVLMRRRNGDIDGMLRLVGEHRPVCVCASWCSHRCQACAVF